MCSRGTSRKTYSSVHRKVETIALRRRRRAGCEKESARKHGGNASHASCAYCRGRTPYHLPPANTRGSPCAHTLAVIAAARASPRPPVPRHADILAANKAATGGAVWDRNATLKTEYDYSGMGMTGKVSSTADLTTAAFESTTPIGPVTQVQGYRRRACLEQGPSGTVTPQNGAGNPLAVNKAYRDANLWWRKDFGGAQVSAGARKNDGGKTYDVVTFVPKDGGTFDAWFDAKTHLLYRIDEKQGRVDDHHHLHGLHAPMTAR